MLSACEAAIFRACCFGPDQGKWGRPPRPPLLEASRLVSTSGASGKLPPPRADSRHGRRRLRAASRSCELVPTLLRGGSGRPHPEDGPDTGETQSMARFVVRWEVGAQFKREETMPSCPRPWPPVPAGPPPGRASSPWQPPGALRGPALLLQAPPLPVTPPSSSPAPPSSQEQTDQLLGSLWPLS